MQQNLKIFISDHIIDLFWSVTDWDSLIFFIGNVITVLSISIKMI